MKSPVSTSEFPVTVLAGDAMEMTADEKFAKSMDMTVEEVNMTIGKLQEVNPMLGFRGCRLGVCYPELVEMQARAVAEAAVNNRKNGLNPKPEIMIPLIGTAEEFKDQSNLIKKIVEKVQLESKDNTLEIPIGSMIEVPRAALTSQDIAGAGAAFFSYGTNDLTQMTFGISRFGDFKSRKAIDMTHLYHHTHNRDDVGNFLPEYIRKGIYPEDPFQTIDAAVGSLIKMSATAGKLSSVNKRFKTGICGEHGGDSKSVKFFAKTGVVDYVSCSPYRVPVARLAAAQGAIMIDKEKK